MRVIDGSHGEGGGQLVRTACALSAITGEPLHLINIRARREPPGLAPQHMAAVQAVAMMCSAEVEGLTLRATEIVFRPQHPRGGDYRIDVGTAGSVTLVLQACLPAALAARAAVTLRIRGGTDVRAAPPLDYFRYVLLPLLARFGAQAEVRVLCRGYYPRGGGEVEVVIHPSVLVPVQLESPGAREEIGGISHVANLPVHIVERMQGTAERLLARFGAVHVEPHLLGPDRAIGAGGAIVLWARTAHSVLGAGEVAQRGVPAERIARTAAEALAAELEAGAAVDLHAADQLLIYCALAGAGASFTVRALSAHAQTTMWVIEQFLPVRFETGQVGALTRIVVNARG